MRPYRGKTKDKDERWVKGWYSYNSKRNIHMITEDNNGTWEVIPETVGQFVCKDKNGKEIYEGDIAYEAFIEKFGYYNIPEDCQGREYQRDEITGVVEYEEKECSFRIKRGDNSFALIDTADELEVIGNATENSELLEEKKKQK